MWYLIFALGFYVGAAMSNPVSFKDADKMSILRGILGTLLWPIVIPYLLYIGKNKNE